MAKLTNVRERVHQPFRDTLIRTSGYYASAVQDRTNLFTVAGKTEGETNLPQGSQLPSDQSMVILALRVFTWFRRSVPRSGAGITTSTGANGDFFITGANDPAAVILMNGNGPGSYNDVYRLNWQAEEQLLWSFGAGDKDSIKQMPSAYFPYGGGLHGSMGGATDLIHWNNGMPDHAGILRIARAILLPPRQNIRCTAQIVALPDGGNAATFLTNQVARNMLSLTSNLNACDLVQKVVSMTFDGLFSRDVQ
jgi:hypothetical protein